MKNGGRYHQEFFLEQRATSFPTPVVVAVTVSIPVVVTITDIYTSSRKFTTTDQGGGTKVEGRPNSTILAAKGG
jgi:hypothetical protein